MTYEQLITLDAIIQAGSFKAASELLFKSQPSISVAIKKLEEEFQIQIFNRDGYRPVLTSTGRSFYEKSKLALFQMESLQALGSELAMGIEPEIKLGMDAICPGSLFYSKIKNFIEKNDKTNLHLSVDILNGTVEKLISGEIQFGIFNMLSLADQLHLFESVPLIEVEMIPVIGNLNSRAPVKDIESLKQVPQVIIHSTGTSNTSSFGILEGGRKWYVNDILTKKEILLAGLGWGAMPDHMIQDHLESGELQKIELDGTSSRKAMVHLVRKKTTPLGPVAKELWKTLSLK
jgi:DNA-binding transcriptional LysR family regulator